MQARADASQHGWHDAGPLDALAEGLATVVIAGDEPVLLVRSGQAVAATEALCPHKFTSLEGGHVAAGCITCPLHDATFSLETGQPEPGQEWAGRLPIHEARVVDGRVEVRLSTPGAA